MKVTEVKVDNFCPKKKGLCAEVTVIIDDCLAIHKITVLKGDKGLFVGYPSMGDVVLRDGKKRYSDLVHPLNNSLSKEFQDQVLLAYEKYRINSLE